MRKKSILFLALLALSLAKILLLDPIGSERPVFTEKTGRVTVLAAGFDQAAGNTDVLMLTTVDYDAGRIHVLQIPRDTYLSAGTAQNKINQIFPKIYSQTGSIDAAMTALTKQVSDAFGVPVDYWAAVDLAAFTALVDDLGGVTVAVPCDIQYRDPDGNLIRIPQGEQTLKGQQAAHFIRHRAGYTEGDLGRVDAQKLLLAATYSKFKESADLSLLARLLPDLYRNLHSNMPRTEQASLAYSFYRNRDRYGISLMTLPGEATRGGESGALWYYVVNKKAAGELLERFFAPTAPFDRGEVMTAGDRINFRNIYEDRNFSYTVFTEDTLDSLKVKLKNK